MRIDALVIGCLGGWLAACAPVAGQDYTDGSAYIEITQGSYRALETLRIYEDDRMERRVGWPREATSVTDGASGIYTRMARVLADDGPRTAADLAGAHVCPDWGEITIRAEPAVAGVSFMRAGCPNTVIEPLRDALLAIAGR